MAISDQYPVGWNIVPTIGLEYPLYTIPIGLLFAITTILHNIKLEFRTRIATEYTPTMPNKSHTPPDRYSEDWIAKLDGRTRLASVVNERLQLLSADLGDWESLSYQRRSLIKRVVWLEIVIEQQESRLSRDQEVDQGKLTQAVNSLIGLLKTLGLDRVPRDVHSLSDLIERAKS